MSRVFSFLFSGRSSLDSFADRLNCRFTVCLLSVIAALAMMRVLISEPIRCFATEVFTIKQAEFAEQICWSSSTFILRSRPLSDPNAVSTSYYQWIPLILAFQAFCFYLPKLFWNLTSSISGSINIRHIASSEIQRQGNGCDPDEDAAQTMQYMTKCLGRNLVEFNIRWKLATSGERFWLLMSGNWTFIFYIAVKVLYVINVFGQLFLLNAFLGSEDQNGPYGFSALRRLLSGTPEDRWKTSPALPTTFICQYDIMKLGNTYRYSMMCSLPMNLWYEIIFLFLWFWFIFVATSTIASFVYFVFLQFNVFFQERYCRLRLLAMAKANEAQSIQVSQFVHNFLTRDAWFIVQKVGTISGDQKATQLVCGLWENYIAYKQQTDCSVKQQKSHVETRDL